VDDGVRVGLLVTPRGRHAPLLIVVGVVLAILAGCGESRVDAPRERDTSARGDSSGGAASATVLSSPVVLVDAAGDTLRLTTPPERIVALVPSVTRVIAELGEGERLVGRTRYDTATALADLPSVGAGMGPDYEALVALRADLVVYFVGASDPETPAQLERLGLRGFGVRPDDISDVLHLYDMFGRILGQPDRADALARGLESTLDSIRTAVAGLEASGSLGVTYLLDGDPPWAAGPSSYIGQLVELAGGTLRPAGLPPLYSPVSPEALIASAVDVILLSGDSDIDPRLVRGRRLERIPDWVEVPGPEVRQAAWVIADALHPGLGRSPPARNDGGPGDGEPDSGMERRP